MYTLYKKLTLNFINSSQRRLTDEQKKTPLIFAEMAARSGHH